MMKILRRFIPRIYMYLSVLMLFSTQAAAYNSAPAFTAEEQKYINEKKEITVGVIDSNEPHSYFLNGSIEGSSIELLNKISEISDLKFKYRIGSWSDIFAAFTKGEVDAIDGISYTDERSRYIMFTKPYHLRETVIFTRGDEVPEDFSGLKSLKDKRIGIIKDIYYSKLITDSKDFTTYEFSDYTDLIKALAYGWVDAVISSEMTALYIARENHISNIKMAGPTGIDGLQTEDFRIGVLKVNNTLAGIFSKTLDSIPQKTITALEKSWLSNFFSHTDKAVVLTEDENTFIRNNPAVSIGFMTDFDPFSFEVSGNLKGYTVSLLELITKKTGLKFRHEKGSWSNLLNSFQTGKIDSLADISYTQERQNYTLFSEEYNRIPTVVFVRDDFGQYEGLQNLAGKKIGVKKDIFFMPKLSKKLKAHFIQYDTQEEMVNDLSFGNIDAVINALNSGNNIIKKSALTNIRIAGELKIDERISEDLRFGIRKDMPELRSIINKGLSAISIEEHIKLENSWLAAKDLKHGAGKVSFSPQEKEYLENKGTIKMCSDPDWMPFEMLKTSGEHVGMAADYFELLKNKIDTELIIVPTKSWNESLQYVRELKCDILTLAMKTPDRNIYLDFTKPYFTIPNVIASSVNQPFIENFEDVISKPIGSVKGYAITELIKKQYPDINLIEVASDKDGLAMLQRGDLYGYIGTMASIGYHIQQQRIVDIKISGRLPGDWELSVATRNDEPELHSIFEKLVASVSEEEKNKILNTWMSVRFDEKFDYSLFWKFAAGTAVFLLFAAYWSNKLRVLNKKLQHANIKLQELSEKDELTGLYNRRFFISHSEHSFSICMRNSICFSIAVIDIDHFKKLNDTYGHLMGDECLRQLADMLRKHFQRTSDTVSRYGGEEFTVYCACGDSSKLGSVIEQLRSEVERMSVAYQDETASFTISAGVYNAVPSSGDKLEKFLDNADKALYEAKKLGRNRVVVSKSN